MPFPPDEDTDPAAAPIDAASGWVEADPAPPTTDASIPSPIGKTSQRVIQLGLPSTYWKDFVARAPTPVTDSVGIQLAQKPARLWDSAMGGSIISTGDIGRPATALGQQEAPENAGNGDSYSSEPDAGGFVQVSTRAVGKSGVQKYEEDIARTKETPQETAQRLFQQKYPYAALRPFGSGDYFDYLDVEDAKDAFDSSPSARILATPAMLAAGALGFDGGAAIFDLGAAAYSKLGSDGTEALTGRTPGAALASPFAAGYTAGLFQTHLR